LIEIREPRIQDGGGIDGVIHIVLVPIKAGDIAARAKFQGAAPLRMPLGSGRLTGEAKGADAGKRPAGTRQKSAPRKRTCVTCLFCRHG
jgi:hypothetical protein